MKKRTKDGTVYSVNSEAFFAHVPKRRKLTGEMVAKAQLYRRKLLDLLLEEIKQKSGE